MEDDKTPASPRKRTAKATPTDTSKPSATTDPTASGAGRTPRPRKVPPATFVSPGQPAAAPPPSQPAAAAPPPSQPAAAAPPSNPAPPATTRQPAKKPPAKNAAAKKAAPKKATPKAAPVPAVATTQEMTERPQPEREIVERQAPTESTTPVRPAPLWPTIKANPGYATELLALAAVSYLGPQARTDLRWLRDTYPNATTHGLARMATTRSVRQVRTQGAVAGLLGPVAVLAGTGALLWTQARLVLDVAAAYGRDPADPERAVELLTLLRVHPDPAAAREAITAAREAAAHTSPSPHVTLPVVRVVGRALGRMTIARRMARLAPGACAALTAILDGRATEQLAVRATKFYRN